MADNTNSIYTNMKGKTCPLTSNICWMGDCSGCVVPKRIPIVQFQGRATDVFGRIKTLSKEHGDMTLGILDTYFGRSYN